MLQEDEEEEIDFVDDGSTLDADTRRFDQLVGALAGNRWPVRELSVSPPPVSNLALASPWQLASTQTLRAGLQTC